ncbi:hypothetical protein B0T10DRAFT_588795 [Thelonectria olida]|uniref:NmrA-like domain-containing protein n=1 Tax=Thelonectria olida TaxID=1576542 RepID=A0A9P8VTJ3_9HYPO|nr:hypothetical protein B0T10DRAFT_588795 [Thelonectria olida]
MPQPSDKKVIVVVGGTGRIGRSVALSLHDDPNFHVKVTTRDVTSDKAKRIESAAIELVKADSWSSSELNDAFKGAWGVFLNTNSEDLDFVEGSKLKESEMGILVIDAARRQSVDFFIFAGLPEAAKLTNDAVHISSFIQKNEISRYGQAAGFKSYVNVNAGWQVENFWNPVYEKPFGGFARVKDAEGYLTIKLFPMGDPPKPTPFTSIRDDYGDIVHGVFTEPERWNTQTVWAVSHPVTLQGVAQAYNRVTGTDVARWVLPKDEAQAATPEKAKEVGGVKRYVELVNGNYCDGKPIDQTAAEELKKKGVMARNRSGCSTELQTIEGFIRAYSFNNEAM